MSIGTAVRAFFAALSNAETSERIAAAIEGTTALEQTERPAALAEKQPERPATTGRSEALTVLSALQRETRLIDLVMEPLDEFEDAQVGAAAREVLRDSQKVLERMFAIQPLCEAEEGATIEVPEGGSPNLYRTSGGDYGEGIVTHRGWKASQCEVPKWSGKAEERWVLAPTEVELQQ